MITEHVIMNNIANFQGELLKKLHEQETILNLFNNFFYDLGWGGAKWPIFDIFYL